MEKAISKNRTRWAIGSAFFLHGLCFSSWGARIPSLQQKLSLSEVELGSVLFALPIGSIISMPVASWLVGKYGSRKILTTALVLYSLMLITLSLASSPLQLAALLIAFGFISNMVNVSVNTQAVALESLLGKSVMASLHGLWSLAGFIGAGIGAVMIAMKTDLFSHFLIMFMMAIFIVIFNARFFITENRDAHNKTPTFSLPNKELLGLGLIAFACMICEGAMFDWSGVYFKNVIQVKPEWIGVGYASFMSTMAGTRFFADHLIMSKGINKVLKTCGVLIAVGLMISVVYPTMLTGIIGFLLVGAGTSAVVPLVFAQAGKVPNQSPSSSIAAVSTIGFLGFLFGPPMIGWVAGASSLRISFCVIAMMGLSIYFLANAQFKTNKA